MCLANADESWFKTRLEEYSVELYLDGEPYNLDNLVYSTKEIEYMEETLTLSQFSMPEGVSGIHTLVFQCDYLDFASYFCGEFLDTVIKVQFPEGLEGIGEEDYPIFYNCPNLISTRVPESCYYIARMSFYGSPWYENLEIYHGVKYINNVAYEVTDTSITEVNLKPETVYISPGAFMDCTEITSLTLDYKELLYVGYQSFSNCTGLTKVTIESTREDFGGVNHYAFDGSSNITEAILNYPCIVSGPDLPYLQTLTLGTNVKFISNIRYNSCPDLYYLGTMEEWRKISTLNFFGPSKVTCSDGVIKLNWGITTKYNITSTGSNQVANNNYGFIYRTVDGKKGDSVNVLCNFSSTGEHTVIWQTYKTTLGANFSGCTTLISIIIPEEITSIKGFSGCTNLATIEYKGTIEEWYAAVTDTSWYNDVSAEKVTCSNGDVSLIVTTVIYNVTTTEEATTLVYSVAGIDTMIIDNIKVTPVSSYTFSSLGLHSVKYVFTSKTEIYNNVFKNCANITSVTIGKGVTSISGYAFDSCTNLTTLTIPDSVTTLGNYSFFNSSITSFVIPSKVEGIPLGCFCGCNKLTTITIPKSVAKFGIKGNVFWECTSLTTINFEGTTEEWKSVRFTGTYGNDWISGGVPATKVICSDGEVSLS